MASLILIWKLTYVIHVRNDILRNTSLPRWWARHPFSTITPSGIYDYVEPLRSELELSYAQIAWVSTRAVR